MKAVLFFGALLALAFSAAPAQESSTLENFAIELTPSGEREEDQFTRLLSLAEALDIALADNPQLALARAEEQVARGRRRAVKGSLLVPSLAFGAEVGRTVGRVQGSFGDIRNVTFSTYQGGVSLVYRVNVGAQVNAAIAETRELEAATLRALSAEQQLLLRVSELYQNLMLATVGVQIAEELIESGEQFLRIVRARAAGGMAQGSDVARAEAELAADRQQLIQVSNLRNAISVDLAVVLRLDPRTRLEPADERLKPERFLDPDSDNAVRPGAEVRPDVRAAWQRAEAARRQSQAAWWNIISPELRAEAGQFQIGGTSDELEGRNEWRTTLLWTISPRGVGELQQRRAEEEVARLRSVRTEDRARGEIIRAEQDLAAARLSIPVAGQGLDAAEDSRRLSEARFRAGTAIALEVLDAQDVLADARFNLARAIVEYNSAQARLLAATGTIRRGSFEPVAHGASDHP